MVSDLVKHVLDTYPEVELAFVFGSQAKGTARAGSDVDVAVWAARPLSAKDKLRLVGDIAQATGLAVDLVDLRSTGIPLVGEILAHGQRIVGGDAAHGQLLSRHLVDAADFLPYVRRMLQERRQAWTQAPEAPGSLGRG